MSQTSNKNSLANIIVSFVLSVILGSALLHLIMFFLLEILNKEDDHYWAAMPLFGLFVLIFSLIARYYQKLKLISYFLWFFWILSIALPALATITWLLWGEYNELTWFDSLVEFLDRWIY